jgi:sporulation-control protein spo0M
VNQREEHEVMEIFDRMKSMVGIGKPTLTIGGVQGPARAGEPLRGTVVLRGGEYDSPVKDVTVRLDEERIVYPTPGTPERQFWRRVATQEIAMNGRVLKKDEVLELPFELLLPVGLAVSEGSVSYQLVAETEVPGLNPKAEQTVLVGV